MIEDVEFLVVKEHGQALGGGKPEMEAAGRTDGQVFQDVLFEEDPLATIAAGPQVLTHGTGRSVADKRAMSTIR